MAEDLQQLLDRINRDYLSKAEAEKDSLIAAARAEASGILADARAEAEKIREQAQKDADQFAARGEAAARQAARDIVLSLKNDLKKLLENAVGKAAQQAFTPELMASLIRDLAAASNSQEVKVLCAGRDVEALRAAVAGTVRAAVTAGHGIRAGMQVSCDNSNVYVDITDAAVRDMLQDFMGAELGKLLDGQE